MSALSVPTVDTMILLLVAVLNSFTLWYSRRTEKNTNSMKDALVRTTAAASHAEGKEEGRIAGEVKAAKLKPRARSRA